jgi:Lrp/AsnC family transcriptional regulator for asnA, asnC and gidA
MAFVGVYLDKAAKPRGCKELKKYPSARMPLHHRGILIKIICHNQHLMQLLNTKIQVIEGVSRTETFISLDQQIDRQIQL